MAKITGSYVRSSVADWIDAATNAGRTANFWVNTNALWVDEHGEMFLRQNAEGVKNRNSFDATVLVRVDISSSDSGVMLTKIVVDIRNSYGRWVRQRGMDRHDALAIDELLQ